MNLSNVTRLTHAYKVAPWRVQRQWVGFALLAVAAAAMVATLYLDVTSQAAIAGREIQDLNLALTISEQNSADLETQLAALTSSAVMRQRALALGFRPAEPLEMEYLVVPGYFVVEPPILAASSRPQLVALTILPEYTQSLFDWVDEKIMSSARGW
ncbi:MAG: hypothetical protein Fur002_07570 [Anaerolineales bacterium]